MSGGPASDTRFAASCGRTRRAARCPPEGQCTRPICTSSCRFAFHASTASHFVLGCDEEADALAEKLCRRGFDKDDVTVINCAIVGKDVRGVRVADLTWTGEQVEIAGQCCGWGVQKTGVAGNGPALRHCIRLSGQKREPEACFTLTPPTHSFRKPLPLFSMFVVNDCAMQRHRFVR